MPSEIYVDDTSLYNRYNVDDVFNRVVIAGLINLMNNKIHYDQIYENTVIEDVHVPCMYDFGSSGERFAQDNYTFFGSSCFGGNKIDGKFDMLPRCAIKYTGSQIDSGSITNKSVRGKFMRNENGKLVSYTALLFSIPLTFNFECEMWIDNMDTAFKIEQSLREIFYKNRTYNVLYRGMKIGCCVGFPESTTLNKTVSYAFDAERMIKINFNLAVETYQPVFTELMPADNMIRYIGFDVNYRPEDEKIVSIKLDPIEKGTVLPSGNSFMVTWDASCNVSDLLTLSLSYIDKRNGREHQIATPLYNEGYCVWNIPSYISGYEQPTVTYLVDETIGQYMEEPPALLIMPDENGMITEKSFTVLSPGVFGPMNTNVKVMLEYVNKSNGTTEMSIDDFELNIKGRGVDTDNPVIMRGKPMKYLNSFEKVPIKLKLTYPLDHKFYDEIDNLFII